MEPWQLRSYKREVEIVKNLNYPLVISYVDEFLFNNEKFCLVTRLASNKNLKKFIEKRIKRNNNITEKEIIDFVTMILLALDYLHSKDVVHRDLTLSNILIDNLSLPDGKVMSIIKIGDFGISKFQFE